MIRRARRSSAAEQQMRLSITKLQKLRARWHWRVIEIFYCLFGGYIEPSGRTFIRLFPHLSGDGNKNYRTGCCFYILSIFASLSPDIRRASRGRDVMARFSCLAVVFVRIRRRMQPNIAAEAPSPRSGEMLMLAPPSLAQIKNSLSTVRLGRQQFS